MLADGQPKEALLVQQSFLLQPPGVDDLGFPVFVDSFGFVAANANDRLHLAMGVIYPQENGHCGAELILTSCWSARSGPAGGLVLHRSPTAHVSFLTRRIELSFSAGSVTLI